MTTYALVRDNVVFNLIEWDGSSEVDFGQSVSVIPVPENFNVDIGFLYDGSSFSMPPLTPEQQAAAEEKKFQENISQKTLRISEALQKITIWQTKLLMGRKLTSDETAALNAWLDYIDALEGIDAETPDDIHWPEQPA